MFLYGFMQRAFQASTLIAIMAPILGLLLILRRQSLMADTLSHVSLAGVALGMLLNINPTLTTLAIVILAAIGIEYLRVIFKGYSEISIAILMATGMAVALVLMSFVSGKQNASVEQFLFGSIITINDEQILILLALAIIVVLLYLIFRKPLYVLTFDEDTAHVWKVMQAELLAVAEKNYQHALDIGIAKEVARTLLPEGLTLSKMYMQGSLRSWIHFIQVRDDEGVAQKEVVDVARKVKVELLKQFPCLEEVI